MKYKDKEWLFEQVHYQHRTLRDIGAECGVDAVAVHYYVKKYNIPRPPTEKEIVIELACHRCEAPFKRDLRTLKLQIRAGYSKFFCSLKCKGEHHSEVIGGDTHPNWKGGQVELKCTVCNEVYKVDPYYIDLIKAGERNQVCSRECFLRCKTRNKKTSIEIKMEKELTSRGIDFVEQYKVGPFFVDFFLPNKNIAIECDGDYWHNLPKVVEKDKRKNKFIEDTGIKLHRFWEYEINNDVVTCVDKVIDERRND